MNRLKNMDKKVDNIMRIVQKVMKRGKYRNGILCAQNNLLGQKFDKLMKCRNEIVLSSVY